MIRRILLDARGASAAEFALVLPLLMILTLGTIDAGRYFWELSRAKKATQYGVRIAAVTDPVEGAIATESYIGKANGSGILRQGDIIPAALVPTVTCTHDGTNPSCTGWTGTDASSVDTGADNPFEQIYDRMEVMFPGIAIENVVIRYEGSGVGYAGDPHGPDAVPLITVELQNQQFRPITAFLLASLNLPSVGSSLTAEDAATHNTGWGSQSN
ncbi:TadE/TadG family type IV pilus assembly protein [Sphingomicrobium marinum]|uniref:TadE/TadG family type IV pilus assembly protein n=1 Tax=Sphingomicrobium marinum TaxID=1227950 RepID=UPI0022403E21|nr:TadE/TadG family type IV pilus assembly protein [Sphingomicrobium marinum]